MEIIFNTETFDDLEFNNSKFVELMEKYIITSADYNTETKELTIQFTENNQDNKYNKIVTTIGLYPNGNYKTNGVTIKNLLFHIYYNLTMRFGRALIINGIMIYNGFNNDKSWLENKDKIMKIIIGKNTAPYH